MMKKQALLVSLILLIMAALAACGGAAPATTETPAQDSSEGAATAEPVLAPDAEGQTPLVVWTFDGEVGKFHVHHR